MKISNCANCGKRLGDPKLTINGISYCLEYECIEIAFKFLKKSTPSLYRNSYYRGDLLDSQGHFANPQVALQMAVLKLDEDEKFLISDRVIIEKMKASKSNQTKEKIATAVKDNGFIKVILDPNHKEKSHERK